MAEITADDAKRMSCTKLTKLNLFGLVEADRGEPCRSCVPEIKRGRGDCSKCSEKAAPPPAQRSSTRTKEEPAPSTLTLKQYPLLTTSLLMPTAPDALKLYGPFYAGGRVDSRHGYEKPQLEHRTPLVLRLLDDDGERVIDERSIVRMTGWDVVANDWGAHLGDFGFDARRVEQVYSIRSCSVVDSTVVTPQIRANLSIWSVDALCALVRQKGLEDPVSVLCNCFAMLAGGVAALAHDSEAQKGYCDTLTRIVGDLFRKDLERVTMPKKLLELAEPVDWRKINQSLDDDRSNMAAVRRCMRCQMMRLARLRCK